MEKYSSAIIGHISLDRNTDHLGNTVTSMGGAVLYSSAAAHALGYRVAAVTKLAPGDEDRLASLTVPKEDIFALTGESSIAIENVYLTADKERRTCTCVSEGTPYTADDVPAGIDANLWHLAGLVYGDFSDGMIEALSERGKVAVDVQGYLRHADKSTGNMYFENWAEREKLLPYITFLKTDAAEAEILTGLTDRAETAKALFALGAREIMITHNTEVLVYDGADMFTCPIKSRNLSGRTGRGDTTFAAYINERTRFDARHSLLYATALVSAKMEAPGPYKGTREDVEKYIADFYPEYR